MKSNRYWVTTLFVTLFVITVLSACGGINSSSSSVFGAPTATCGGELCVE